MFEFSRNKNVISGEGGALLINDPRLIERAEIIWQKGTNRKAFSRGEVSKYTWVDVGSSFLPSELTAAFLYAQLEQGKALILIGARCTSPITISWRPWKRTVVSLCLLLGEANLPMRIFSTC